MFKKLSLSALVLAGLTTAAFAAGKAGEITDKDFSFEGPFGVYDENQLQRGLKVYTEVCSSCHGLKFVPLRTLSDEGGPHLPEDQMKAYVDAMFVADETANQHLYDPELEGLRELTPTDHFPAVNSAGAPGFRWRRRFTARTWISTMGMQMTCPASLLTCRPS